MKITNETKVGAITIISVALLILGFNFLKGKKLWSSDTMITGKYGNVQGLQNSNPVIINGLQVGTVYKITTEKDMREILVDLNITKDINIPKNSIAIIKSNPLGTTSVEIKLGDAVENLKNKDFILTETSGGMFDDVLKKVSGLHELVKNYLKNVPKNEVSLMSEFLLHGLSEYSQISKRKLESTLKFSDLIGSIFNMKTEDEE